MFSLQTKCLAFIPLSMHIFKDPGAGRVPPYTHAGAGNDTERKSEGEVSIPLPSRSPPSSIASCIPDRYSNEYSVDFGPSTTSAVSSGLATDVTQTAIRNSSLHHRCIFLCFVRCGADAVCVPRRSPGRYLPFSVQRY